MSKNVLIIAPSWIGDAIMSQPLLALLKLKHPEIKIDVFAPAWVLPVYARMNEVSGLIDNPFLHGKLELAKRFSVARALAKNKYDEVYILPNSIKSALIPFWARIPKRVGFTGESRYFLLNHRVKLDKTKLPQMAQRFAFLAEVSENKNAELKLPLPDLALNSSAEQQQNARQTLQLNKPQKRAIFCPGAEFGAAKRWPAAHFASLANLLEKEGFSVCLLGSNKDFALGEQIASASNALNLCGKTSLLNAIDLIAEAQIVVCNDSGLMHVAAALHRPLIALYGSSSPDFTPPLSVHAKIMALDLPCRPCFQRECPLKHLNCLQNISPASVLAKIETMQIA